LELRGAWGDARTGRVDRRFFDYGSHLLVYERYRRDCGAIFNRVVSKLFEALWLGHGIGGMYYLRREAASILVSKESFIVCSMCLEHRHRGGLLYGFCIGDEDCIALHAELRGYSTLFLPFEPRKLNYNCILRDLRNIRFYKCFRTGGEPLEGSGSPEEA